MRHADVNPINGPSLKTPHRAPGSGLDLDRARNPEQGGVVTDRQHLPDRRQAPCHLVIHQVDAKDLAVIIGPGEWSSSLGQTRVPSSRCRSPSRPAVTDQHIGHESRRPGRCRRRNRPSCAEQEIEWLALHRARVSASGRQSIKAAVQFHRSDLYRRGQAGMDGLLPAAWSIVSVFRVSRQADTRKGAPPFSP